MTGQDIPDPPSSGRRGKSKQNDLHVIKARVTPAERDQIIASAKARSLSISDFLREVALREPKSNPYERPADGFPELDVRIKRLDAIASTLSDAALSLKSGEGSSPAGVAGRASKKTEARGETLTLASVELDVAKQDTDVDAIASRRSGSTSLTLDYCIVGMMLFFVLTFFAWHHFMR